MILCELQITGILDTDTVTVLSRWLYYKLSLETHVALAALYWLVANVQHMCRGPCSASTWNWNHCPRPFLACLARSTLLAPNTLMQNTCPFPALTADLPLISDLSYVTNPSIGR